MLEMSTFYIDISLGQFVDFNAYKNSIMSANNILDIEKINCFGIGLLNFLKP